MKVVSKEPLSVMELVRITKNKPIQLGSHMCRVMSLSVGQEVEVIEVVKAFGHKWGVKKLNEPKEDYDCFAFVVGD